MIRLWNPGPELESADATTRVFAWLGRRGGGKTHGAGRFAEEMLDQNWQVVVLDPVGVWWALRLNADGKSPAYDIPVLGGLHADMPIEASGGRLVGEALAKSASSAVLDVSMLRKSDGGRARFLADFAESFSETKATHRNPVHVILDEAQEIVPQTSRDKHGTRLLGAFESLVKLGRNFGIGVSLLSQRPQSVHKDVLNQADALVCFGLTGPQERKAVEGWIREHEDAKGERALLKELPNLQPGQAIVWSPSWLKSFFRTTFLPKRTFDASKTPTGSANGPKLAKLDLSALRSALEAGTKREPIAVLADSKGSILKAPPEQDREIFRRTVVRAENAEKRAQYLETRLAEAVRAVGDAATAMQVMANQTRDLTAKLAAFAVVYRQQPLPDVERALQPPLAFEEVYETAPTTVPGALAGAKAGARRMLAIVVAWHGVRSLTKAQLGTLAGITPTSGTWSEYLGLLKKRELVRLDGDRIQPTPAGMGAIDSDWFAEFVPGRTAMEKAACFGKHFKAGARRMLGELFEAYPHPLTVAELGRRTGIEPTSGTFSEYKGRLVNNGLVEKTGGGFRIAEWLYTAGQEAKRG